MKYIQYTFIYIFIVIGQDSLHLDKFKFDLSLDSIYSIAVKNSHEINIQRTMIKHHTLLQKIEGRFWMKAITISGSASFGTYNAEQMVDVNYSSSLGNKQNYGLNISARFSVYDIFSRGLDSDLREIQIDRAHRQQKALAHKVKTNVFNLYSKFRECYKLVPLKYQMYVNTQIRRKAVEQKFIDNEFALAEYAKISQAEVTAYMVYQRSRIELETCYNRLLRVLELDEGATDDFSRIY